MPLNFIPKSISATMRDVRQDEREDDRPLTLYIDISSRILRNPRYKSLARARSSSRRNCTRDEDSSSVVGSIKRNRDADARVQHNFIERDFDIKHAKAGIGAAAKYGDKSFIGRNPIKHNKDRSVSGSAL